MDRNDPTAVAALTISEHYLKDDLYDRISANSAIFEFIQANSLDGIWYWNIENPAQEWMSERSKELLGYKDSEVASTCPLWQQNIFPEDLTIALDNFHKHCADPNHPYDHVVRYRHKNGSTVWVRRRGLAIRDAGGRPIRMLGAYTDVTAMKRTEERIRALFEASPDMYFVADLETGIIRECNQALAEHTGQAHVLGTSFFALCDPDSVKLAKGILSSLANQHRVRDVELTIRRANGAAFPVLLSADTIQDDPEHRSFRAWCRDISHLKRFANVEALFSALPTGVLLINPASIISSANSAADKMFGYRKGELAGRPLATLLSGSDCMIDLASGVDVDLKGLRPDGSTFPIHIEMSTMHLGEGSFGVATIADMSARKGVENVLRESEYRFRQLAESLPQLVWTSTPEGNCDYLSPQWVAYTGVSETEQLELGWMNQIHPEDRHAITVAWSAAVRGGAPLKCDYRLRRYDGCYRWFEASGIPLRSVENHVVKWFGSCTDVHERRETGQALDRERKLLANLITQAPAIFFSFALRPDGTSCFPYASPDIIDLWGVEPADLKENAEHIFARIHKEDAAGVRASLTTSAQTMSRWSLQFRVSHPVKGERWIEGNSSPAIESRGLIVWQGFLTDVTERKQVEADQQFLFELGSALQTAGGPEEIAQIATRIVTDHFDVAHCTLSAVDPVRGEVNLVYAHAKHGPSSQQGLYALADWSGEGLSELLATGSTVAINNTATDRFTASKYGPAFQAAQIEAVVAIPLRRRGEWACILCLLSSRIRMWSRRETDLARSAAERVWPAYEAARAMEAERAINKILSVSEERLRLALQSAAIGIWELDPVTDKRIWDVRCKSVFGFPPDLSVEDDIVQSCIHPDDRELVERRIAEYRDPAGNGIFEVEYRIFAWDGTGLRHIYGQGQMFFEGLGEERRAIRAIGTVQDISALKKTEQALRRVNFELEQFASAAAHDLQEPLRNVGLATQILTTRYKGRLDNEADGLLKIGLEGSERMQAMVRDLLAYSRALASDEEEIPTADSNATLELTLKNLVVAIREKQARITWEKLPNVRMRELHLTQIFQNLIGNSLKYSSPRQPQIHIAAEQRSGEWVMSVKDNGQGIPAEHHERAFGVFKRLHGSDVPGTGIGLALCKRIVEHYAGKIWIESAPGEGTTILFTPPVAKESLEAGYNLDWARAGRVKC